MRAPQPQSAQDAPSSRLIEITVDDVYRLFHALDPSPIAHRDLDEGVERYIVHAAQERPRRDYALAVNTAGPALAPDEATALSMGIRAYFAHRSEEEAQKLRSLARDGREALTIGLVFLFVCAVLGLLALRLLPAPFGVFVEQGLLIIGWVANWRPVDVFLYELRPIRSDRDLLATLSRMEVQFRASANLKGAGNGRNAQSGCSAQ